jgi:hypothetical protein
MSTKTRRMLHRSFTKKNWLLFSIGTCIAVIAFGSIVYQSFSQKTYPLGDELEYVGKSDYGCLYICSAWPGTTFYYATDMTTEEVVGYFKGARRDPSLDGPGGYVSSSTPYTFDSLGLRTPSGIFIINIYSDSNLTIRDYGLMNTTKATVLSLDKKYFLEAQQSL